MKNVVAAIIGIALVIILIVTIIVPIGKNARDTGDTAITEYETIESAVASDLN